MNITYQSQCFDENGIHLCCLEDFVEIVKSINNSWIFHDNFRHSFAIIKEGIIIQAPDYNFRDFKQAADALSMGFNEPNDFVIFLDGNLLDKQQFQMARSAGVKTRLEYEQMIKNQKTSSIRIFGAIVIEMSPREGKLQIDSQDP